MLAIAMQDGYAIHHIETRVHLVLVAHNLKAPGPVTFLHGGLALLGASSKGEVCLWGSGDGEKLQGLCQDGRCFAIVCFPETVPALYIF